MKKLETKLRLFTEMAPQDVQLQKPLPGKVRGFFDRRTLTKLVSLTT